MEKRTPGKPMQNIVLEKTAQNKYFTLGCVSPFRYLPSISTPPSRISKIKNPFESHLSERLHHSMFSPSVFNIQSTKTEEKFKWTIEEISNLNPADIDETTVEQFESNEHDSDTETTAQAQIESYFNEKHIVPSPYDVMAFNVPLISQCNKQKQFVEGAAQTILTLPPILPDHVERILKPYFSYTADQQEENGRNSLNRRLFELNETHLSHNSVLTSPAPSCVPSPIELSPYDEAHTKLNSNFGVLDDDNRIPDCLSPITSNTGIPRTASATRLNFSAHMSIDNSLNLVPDTDQVPSNNQSLAFESMHSPPPELLSNSEIHWDLEYKHVSLASSESDNSEDEMDVSNSNTPKSKIFISQRKKLSDSFLRIEESDEDKENSFHFHYREQGHTKNNLYVLSNSTTDGGYHTGSGLPMSDESWNSTNLYASTPTKKKN